MIGWQAIFQPRGRSKNYSAPLFGPVIQTTYPMTKHYLRDLQSEAAELLNMRGQWVVAGVKTGLPWPKTPQVVPFGGLDFILRPLTNEDAASVCLNVEKAGITSKEARDLILQFGSALAWSEGSGFEVTMWTGGSHAIRIGRRRMNMVTDYLDPSLLPHIPNDDAAAALAFYREGVSSDNNFYAFLNFYKAITFIHRDGKQRGAWIDKALPKLKQEDAKSRIKKLEADGINPSKYLRDDGRHAIAHAEKDVFVNPDKLVDHERIYRDLPIMRALATKAIEEQFQIYQRLSQNVPATSGIPGFERIFGPELIEKLLRKEDFPEVQVNLPDSITALIRHGNRIIAFEGLVVNEMKRWEDGCALKMANRGDTLAIAVGIDLPNHKLVFQPEDNCGAKLNQTSRSSIELLRKLREFIWLYYGNGRLELWSEETDELLGVTDPYIPQNMFLDHKTIEKTRKEMQQLLDAATED